MKKKIDLIIPVYKAHKNLSKMLNSIAMQKDIECVQITLVNDCCPEGSYQDIINLFKPMLNIQEIILTENHGPGYARRIGIEKTFYPYIMFADADDTFLNALSISELLYYIEEFNENIICSSFIEERQDMEPAPHVNDIAWIFGKIYRRDFLKKYNINFTDCRANEDVCFNKKIMMWYGSHEKDVQFINLFTYLWQNNQNSITKINKNQYTYDQSIPGLIDGTIDLLQWAEKNKINQQIIKKETYDVLGYLYMIYGNLQFLQINIGLEKQFLYYAKKFAQTTWKKEYNYQEKMFVESFQNNLISLIDKGMIEASFCMNNNLNIYDFLNKILNEPYSENELKEAFTYIDNNIKQKNIECGVCSENYYKDANK